MTKKAFTLDKLIFSEKLKTLILKKGPHLSLLDVFSLFNKEKLCNLNEIRGFWKEYILESKKRRIETKISFYIHIPFCQSKCEYCRHFYWQCHNAKELDYYLKSLIFKMNFFKDVFSDIKFKTLYIGGGTPSLLSERQLKNLFTNLYKNFKFEENGEKTLECNPFTTTFRKLKILEHFGINRISFGVQSTNEKILKSMNRGYQSFDLIKRTINNAKKCKFKRINVDLMIGLAGDSAETAIKSFSQVAALRPDSIALYPLQPTDDYLKKFYNSNKKYFYKELKNKINEFFALIKKVAEKYNYLYFFPLSEALNQITDEWNFISKEYTTHQEKQFSFIYDDTEKIDCFGLGTQSASYIFGKLRYQDVGKGFYPLEPTERMYRAIKFNNLREQKLYYLLIELDSNRLSLRAYERLFSSNLLEDFQRAITELKKLNKIKIKRDLIFLTSKSPFQRFVDSIFFLIKAQ